MIQLRGWNPFASEDTPSPDTVKGWWGSITSPSEHQSGTAIFQMPIVQPATPSVNTPNVPNPLFQPVTPGTTVVTTGSKPWWASWWLLGLAAAGGVGLWMYSRPKSSPASTAISGLFKRRR